MSKRSDTLADRIEQCAKSMTSFAETLSNDEWHTLVPNDERTVGMLIHHVASMYPLEIELAQDVAMGKPIVGVNWDAVAAMNAAHAHKHAEIGQREAIDLLQQSSKVAADRVRKFTDDELDTAATISLNADAPLTAQFFIEDHAVRHSLHHLANIRAALRR